MTKMKPEEKMFRLAKLVADSIVIPEHCTLERDDIFQEVCLLYLERGYTQAPGILRERVMNAMNRYVKDYGCEIACGSLEEVIEYNIETSETAAVISAVAATSLEEVFKLLTPREVKVLRIHFGIGENELNLDEIGKIFNVGGPRAGQIESKAIRKLRHPSRYKHLLDAIDMIVTGEYFR